MSKNKSDSLEDRLSKKYWQLCEELSYLVSQQRIWDTALTIVNNSHGNGSAYDHCVVMRDKFNSHILEMLRAIATIDQQLTDLTDKQKKYDTLGYSIEDIVNGITNNVPMDYSSFNEFMILLTANIGELQGRIGGLPDSIEWKKDALEKLNILLDGGKKHG